MCRLLRESRQRLTIPEADEERWPGSYPGADSPEAPSTSGKDVGCPVFVMLPLDTVWVVERDGKRVSMWARHVRKTTQPRPSMHALLHRRPVEQGCHYIRHSYQRVRLLCQQFCDGTLASRLCWYCSTQQQSPAHVVPWQLLTSDLPSQCLKAHIFTVLSPTTRCMPGGRPEA